MMILKVFAVRDNKAMAFLQPFYSPSVPSALRAFGDAVVDVNCPFNKHPEDYFLFEIGSYNDFDASFASTVPVKLLASASDFVTAKPVIYAPAVIEQDLVSNGKKSS